jgi:hypothetical protein
LGLSFDGGALYEQSYPVKPMKLLRWTFLPLALASLSLSSCSGEATKAAVTAPLPAPIASPLPLADTFEAGLTKASDASYTAKTAEKKEDWALAAERWQRSIELMQGVPKESPNYSQAQKKLTEYKKNLTLAQNRKKRTVSAAAPVVEPLVTISSVAAPSTKASSATTTAPVTRAKAAAPSMSDFLEEYMDAVVNRGSSGSEYWCSQSKQFESSFFSPRSWRLLNTHTAPNGRGVVSPSSLIRVTRVDRKSQLIGSSWSKKKRTKQKLKAYLVLGVSQCFGTNNLQLQLNFNPRSLGRGFFLAICRRTATPAKCPLPQ